MYAWKFCVVFLPSVYLHVYVFVYLCICAVQWSLPPFCQFPGSPAWQRRCVTADMISSQILYTQREGSRDAQYDRNTQNLKHTNMISFHFCFAIFETNICLQTILIAYFWCTAHRPWAVLNTFFFASCSTLFVFVCACVFVLYSSVTARLEFSRRWYDLSCFGGDQRRRQLGWSYLAGEAERTLLPHSTGYFVIKNTNTQIHKIQI